tara:strand:+ start:356 stop:541 length:186 start_codon:yes stop_codon:yes gene_type:complete
MAVNRRLIPDGMEPIEWASAVWQAMDEQGFSQDEAKDYVRAARADATPSRDKMMRSPMKKE